KLCGNSRELSQQCITTESKSPPVKEIGEDSPIRKLHNLSSEKVNDSKENFNPTFESIGVDLDVHVKWEDLSKENPGIIITTLKVVKGSTLADLHKLIEIYLGADNQEFNFLDISGAPVSKEEESITPVSSKLPLFNFNNQMHGYLACLRPVKGTKQPIYEPFSSLENKLPLTLKSHGIEGH
ncbi:kinesin-like protein KIN-10A, partial [Capsicum annuum]